MKSDRLCSVLVILDLAAVALLARIVYLSDKFLWSKKNLEPSSWADMLGGVKCNAFNLSAVWLCYLLTVSTQVWTNRTSVWIIRINITSLDLLRSLSSTFQECGIITLFIH